MIKKDLFDTNASLYVLSCLMRNPLLLQNDKYAFVKTDFYKPLQQMVFATIYNFTDKQIVIKRGEKICQGRIDKLSFTNFSTTLFVTKFIDCSNSWNIFNRLYTPRVLNTI